MFKKGIFYTIYEIAGNIGPCCIMNKNIIKGRAETLLASKYSFTHLSEKSYCSIFIFFIHSTCFKLLTNWSTGVAESLLSLINTRVFSSVFSLKVLVEVFASASFASGILSDNNLSIISINASLG